MAVKSSSQKNSLITRPPVVVIMGHIDHGKSTLLDYIRKTNVTASEAGGITQHLSAYEVVHKSPAGRITFLDTPGHEAFCDIRSRGANVADIAVLVVSAEDGVKPQTLEALACAKEAKVPCIIAINKIDKPTANLERAKQNLAENEIYIEGYGGDVPAVAISALTGEGIPDLLDMILLVAELAELKADPNVPAEGVVIEASLDRKKGISATLIIKNGSLHAGEYIVAEGAVSPVRIFEDFQGKKIKEATFSSPVTVIGFNAIPTAGAAFKTYDSKKEAEKNAQDFLDRAKKAPETKNETDVNDNRIIIPLIIKADALGSLDGIKHELEKLKNDRTVIKIVHEGIGDITENDIKVASGVKDGVIAGFNVAVDAKARNLAERLMLEINVFTIIYNLLEHIANIPKIRTPKQFGEKMTVNPKILKLISKTKDRQILGGKAQGGVLAVGEEVKILRRDVEIARGRIRELQSQKIKVSEIREGFEFGAMIEAAVDIQPGDKIEGFKTVEK